jgi:enterochelin esterase-like enzyme
MVGPRQNQAILAAILCLAASGAALGQRSGGQSLQPRPPAGDRPAPMRRDGARPRPASELPNGEWLEPNRGSPNGTQYKTFTSEVLGGKEVSYLIYLPDGYEQSTTRYPVIYWLHGMGGNQLGGAMMFLPQFQTAVREGVAPPAIVVLVNGMVGARWRA